MVDISNSIDYCLCYTWNWINCIDTHTHTHTAPSTYYYILLGSVVNRIIAVVIYQPSSLNGLLLRLYVLYARVIHPIKSMRSIQCATQTNTLKEIVGATTTTTSTDCSAVSVCMAFSVLPAYTHTSTQTHTANKNIIKHMRILFALTERRTRETFDTFAKRFSSLI